MLSISTAFFNVSKRNSWTEVLSEAGKTGLLRLELSVEIPGEFLEEIERSVANGEITISSLHNYCPKLNNLPKDRTIYSGYLLSSDNEEERRAAVKFTHRTIEWAKRLGAKAVVIHAGEIPTDPSGREFFSYVEQFGTKDRFYEKYIAALRETRRQRAGLYLDRIIAGLGQILDYASKTGVSIGLENRFFLNEIPDVEELSVIFDKFEGAPVGYWHDTGHAEVCARLGWVNKHTDFLEPFKDKIIGMHLHDLRKLSDHYAPGTGDFDFKILMPYLVNVPLQVIEAHPKSSIKDIERSIALLKGLLVKN